MGASQALARAPQQMSQVQRLARGVLLHCAQRGPVGCAAGRELATVRVQGFTTILFFLLRTCQRLTAGPRSHRSTFDLLWDVHFSVAVPDSTPLYTSAADMGGRALASQTRTIQSQRVLDPGSTGLLAVTGGGQFVGTCRVQESGNRPVPPGNATPLAARPAGTGFEPRLRGSCVVVHEDLATVEHLFPHGRQVGGENALRCRGVFCDLYTSHCLCYHTYEESSNNCRQDNDASITHFVGRPQQLRAKGVLDHSGSGG